MSIHPHREGLDRDLAAYHAWVPEFMHPVIALTTAGVEIDVLDLTYDQYDDATREAVVAALPRTPAFKEDII